MAKISQTVAVATADTAIVLTLTEPGNYLRAKNCDAANGVWLKWINISAVAAEQDEAVFVGPTNTINLPPGTFTLRGIAITGTVKVNFYVDQVPLH